MTMSSEWTADEATGLPWDPLEALERCRAEREAQIAELAPVAAPHIDSVAYSISRTAADVLKRVAAAIARVEAGRYGTCLACRSRIAIERLRLVPYAERCVGCAES